MIKINNTYIVEQLEDISPKILPGENVLCVQKDEKAMEGIDADAILTLSLITIKNNIYSFTANRSLSDIGLNDETENKIYEDEFEELSEEEQSKIKRNGIEYINLDVDEYGIDMIKIGDKLLLLGEQSRKNKICNWSTRGKDYSLTINEGDILVNRREGSLIKLLKEKMNYPLLDSYGILTLNDFPDLKIKLFYIRMDNYIYSYVIKNRIDVESNSWNKDSGIYIFNRSNDVIVEISNNSKFILKEIKKYLDNKFDNQAYEYELKEKLNTINEFYKILEIHNKKVQDFIKNPYDIMKLLMGYGLNANEIKKLYSPIFSKDGIDIYVDLFNNYRDASLIVFKDGKELATAEELKEIDEIYLIIAKSIIKYKDNIIFVNPIDGEINRKYLRKDEFISVLYKDSEGMIVKMHRQYSKSIEQFIKVYDNFVGTSMGLPPNYLEKVNELEERYKVYLKLSEQN